MIEAAFLICAGSFDILMIASGPARFDTDMTCWPKRLASAEPAVEVPALSSIVRSAGESAIRVTLSLMSLYYSVNRGLEGIV